MNQSAIRALCSCVVLAAVAVQAHAGNSRSSAAPQASRELLELSIRQRSAAAHKMVQQDAIKYVTSKTFLLAQLQASLNPQPLLALTNDAVAREPDVEPSAD